MSYYLAPALAVLRDEINARWPGRDRTSDGWIGDPAHQATRSDHNPNDRGSVNAIDVDRDGVDIAAIIAAIEAHPSAHYWIVDQRIADADDGWRPRPYTGTNPHDKHLHVSIRQTRTAEQDQRPWGILEDTMPLNADDLDAVRTQVAKGIYDALHVAATGKTYRGLTYQGEGSIGAAIRANLAALVVSPVLAGMAARDLVDEQQVAADVAAELAPALLAVLTPEAIASAIPDTVARQVADVLAARLAA